MERKIEREGIDTEGETEIEGERESKKERKRNRDRVRKRELCNFYCTSMFFNTLVFLLTIHSVFYFFYLVSFL